ncbi:MULTISPECIES: AraC family transcriptional regulator [Bacillus]|uniref:AraC family transcriptional regulator n=1 Tax=Bacillus glycinifermentans TaxID=1664069 RepID=A0AAJ4D1N2_9BACI|nr:MULTISPECIES: AraC family transcriptional regulator [Bacillus]KKB73406.1 AraC family transcriptional regulator [Bacillus sp. TH008]MDU0069613.1 AraC family transcriptional regulator [Bacillus sp. IG6]MED8017408.1 AraC family transcriptional regulator [Bacillus glycinifermentans]QAT64560.1 AraC family transcriptional regulator [Bacillus glycinifermentans]WKB78510.1 AraC family transcriptional regulator [Bacillus glycinifermentans]
MDHVIFKIPPLPVLITCGEGVFKTGEKHVKREYSVFDLLYVIKGELFLTEGGKPFRVTEGEYIILIPGLEHYGHQGCLEDTHYFWLHFQEEAYELADQGGENWTGLKLEHGTFETPPLYSLRLPRKGKVDQKAFIEKQFRSLLDDSAENSDLPLRKQLLFEELLIHLQKEAFRIPSANERVASEAQRYIDRHYKEKLSMDQLSAALHYHQDYITRCMQKVFGQTPGQYANKARMHEAKRLLSVTNDKMSSIAEQVGIDDPTYFSKLFKQMEGMSPVEYRRMIKRSIE